MEVVPIRWVQVRELDPIFDEEACAWATEMYWDVRPALRLLRRHLELGTLEGFVLRRGDQPLGYAYYVVHGDTACLADAYVLKRGATTGAYDLLTRRCIEELQSRRSILRIEVQLVPFHCSLAEPFRARGFHVYRRHYLLLALPAAGIPPCASPQFLFRHWQVSDSERAATIVYDSYRNSPEAFLSRDYQQMEGCRRFIRNVTQSPSCGRFRPDLTELAFRGREDAVGLMMAAEISKGTLMIPQLSIIRTCQSKGLGKALLSRLLASACGAFDRIALSVTESNQQAFRLYSSFGFLPRREFEAYVWSR
ncbi:MAG TPA: GNAT family N-acetyltransferase [Acidobacteriota bacterium]|nr:GNAT family N-acetyltransferase [Acidobacteriota bacterium]